jgi:hypothetical protein
MIDLIEKYNNIKQELIDHVGYNCNIFNPIDVLTDMNWKIKGNFIQFSKDEFEYEYELRTIGEQNKFIGKSLTMFIVQELTTNVFVFVDNEKEIKENVN